MSIGVFRTIDTQTQLWLDVFSITASEDTVSDDDIDWN
jgi:hypothetical protein